MNYINRIMQLYENEETINILDALTPYMLTASNIHRLSASNDNKLNGLINQKQDLKENKLIKKTVIKEKEKEKEGKFIPSAKDKLFWCFYFLLYGYEDYELAKNTSFKSEKDFKIASVEKLHTIKDKLKQCKLKMTEIENELVNQPIITVSGLYALCILHGINLMYVNRRMVYEIIGNETNNGDTKCIVSENQITYVPDVMNEDVLLNYRTNYWKIENINKPLLALTAYSLSDLQTICQKMNIPTVFEKKKLTKKELYEAILTKL
jgi:hypothetical protein